MKTKPVQLAVVFTGLLFGLPARAADPQLDSWLTSYSGRYARVFLTDAAKLAGTSVTTWSKGSLSQSTPAYSGVHETYYSANWVYLRTSGLGAHTMGPWQNGSFPNVPINKKKIFRIPRDPATNSTHALTGLGAIGYFVDGVAMYDSRDAFYWNGTSEEIGRAHV
mgnify:CR=1 FL=1